MCTASVLQLSLSLAMNVVGANGLLPGGRVEELNNEWSYTTIPPYFMEWPLMDEG
jgi:hypothetical protein